MTFPDCIRKVMKSKDRSNVWFRPVYTRGQGWAVALDNAGFIVIVPSPRGSHDWSPINASAIIAEWEIVSPDKVLEERNEWPA